MIPELRNTEWFESNDKTVRFATDMLRAGYFEPVGEETSTEAENLLAYFDKPWNWDREHAWWVVNGWTDDVELWEVGFDTEFDPAETWMLKADTPVDDDDSIDDDDLTYLYWLVDKGWVGLDDATIFKAEERTATIDGHWEAISG